MLKTLSKLFIAFFLSISVGTCFAENINWQSYSSATFAQAKKQHKQVLLFGQASWCPWCRRMKNDTFTDSKVISIINEKYVPIMIDIDDQSSIADRYDISVVPANIILTDDYKVIATSTGYLSASKMSSFLRENAN